MEGGRKREMEERRERGGGREITVRPIPSGAQQPCT